MFEQKTLHRSKSKGIHTHTSIRSETIPKKKQLWKELPIHFYEEFKNFDLIIVGCLSFDFASYCCREV